MGASNSSAIPDGSSEDRDIYPQVRRRSVWSPPPKGRYKVNTDGGCRPVDIDHHSDHHGVQRGPSGYGGILRDHQGNWVQGFIGFIGESDCLTSEIHGILKGLELLDKLKLKGSILETDCQSAYQWITQEGDDHRSKSKIIHACWPIISKCRELVVKNDVAVNLIQRDDANRCADKLADMAIQREEKYVEFKYVPYELRDLVEKETNNSSSSDGSSSTSIETVTAVAAAVAGVATVAWGISKLLSDDTEHQEERNHHETAPSFLNPQGTILIPKGIIKKRSVWSPPPPRGFKINTDGACRPVLGGGGKTVLDDRVQRGPSGYGGILRDHNGNWVRGFLGFIGESDCLTSEIHGIVKGLELLDKLKLTGSTLETDCQSAYEWLTREGDDHRSKSEIVRACWPKIIRCRQLAVKNDITIGLILGDNANRCADKLADMAIQRKQIYVEIRQVPNELRNLVDKDATNYSY